MSNEIYNFEQQITNDINNSNLPIEIVYLVMRYLYQEVEVLYKNNITMEDMSNIAREQKEINNDTEDSIEEKSE